VKVATWNVNGIRAREAQFVEWVRRDTPDVVCLQEIKATPEQLGETLTLLPEYWSTWHGGPKGYSGVSLHFRKETFATRPATRSPPFDFESRALQARLDGHDGQAGQDGQDGQDGQKRGLVVASLYVPNGGKDYAAKLAFLQGLRAHVEAAHAAGDRLILCGDLNVARTDMDVHPKERKVGAIGQRPDERALIESILGLGMVDVARTLHPDTDAMFTWWPPWRSMRQKNQGWRIDYVLASAALPAATQCTVLSDVGTSDHAPVVATFA
jgi:exodeoxyribonuclease-3